MAEGARRSAVDRVLDQAAARVLLTNLAPIQLRLDTSPLFASGHERRHVLFAFAVHKARESILHKGQDKLQILCGTAPALSAVPSLSAEGAESAPPLTFVELHKLNVDAKMTARVRSTLPITRLLRIDGPAPGSETDFALHFDQPYAWRANSLDEMQALLWCLLQCSQQSSGRLPALVRVDVSELAVQATFKNFARYCPGMPTTTLRSNRLSVKSKVSAPGEGDAEGAHHAPSRSEPVAAAAAAAAAAGAGGLGGWHWQQAGRDQEEQSGAAAAAGAAGRGQPSPVPLARRPSFAPFRRLSRTASTVFTDLPQRGMQSSDALGKVTAAARQPLEETTQWRRAGAAEMLQLLSDRVTMLEGNVTLRLLEWDHALARASGAEGVGGRQGDAADALLVLNSQLESVVKELSRLDEWMSGQHSQLTRLRATLQEVEGVNNRLKLQTQNRRRLGDELQQLLQAVQCNESEQRQLQVPAPPIATEFQRAQSLAETLPPFDGVASAHPLYSAQVDSPVLRPTAAMTRLLDAAASLRRALAACSGQYAPTAAYTQLLAVRQQREQLQEVSAAFCGAAAEALCSQVTAVSRATLPGAAGDAGGGKAAGDGTLPSIRRSGWFGGGGGGGGSGGSSAHTRPTSGAVTDLSLPPAPAPPAVVHAALLRCAPLLAFLRELGAPAFARVEEQYAVIMSAHYEKVLVKFFAPLALAPLVTDAEGRPVKALELPALPDSHAPPPPQLASLDDLSPLPALAALDWRAPRLGAFLSRLSRALLPLAAAEELVCSRTFDGRSADAPDPVPPQPTPQPSPQPTPQPSPQPSQPFSSPLSPGFVSPLSPAGSASTVAPGAAAPHAERVSVTERVLATLPRRLVALVEGEREAGAWLLLVARGCSAAAREVEPQSSVLAAALHNCAQAARREFTRCAAALATQTRRMRVASKRPGVLPGVRKLATFIAHVERHRGVRQDDAGAAPLYTPEPVPGEALRLLGEATMAAVEDAAASNRKYQHLIRMENYHYLAAVLAAIVACANATSDAAAAAAAHAAPGQGAADALSRLRLSDSIADSPFPPSESPAVRGHSLAAAGGAAYAAGALGAAAEEDGGGGGDGVAMHVWPMVVAAQEHCDAARVAYFDWLFDEQFDKLVAFCQQVEGELDRASQSAAEVGAAVGHQRMQRAIAGLDKQMERGAKRLRERVQKQLSPEAGMLPTIWEELQTHCRKRLERVDELLRACFGQELWPPPARLEELLAVQ